ncbi:MAG: RDD family protein [Acidobacteriota bacterium]
MKIDTDCRRETPEGVNLSLRPAGPPVRLVAWGIDAMILVVAQFLLAFAFGLMGTAGTGVFLLSLFVLWWFYPVAFEVLRGGVTPGKSAVGLQVVHDDGTPVALAASLLRNLLRFADFLPFAYGAGLASMLLSRDRQRLGDLAAGTLVIYRDEAAVDRRIPTAPAVPPRVPLDREEQRAVVDFGVRYSTWNDERRHELATLAVPLTEATGEAAATKLLGVANWLLGRRGSAG